MKNVYGLVVILFILRLVCCEECCPSSFIEKGICADGKNLTLDCPQKYMVTSNDGYFVIRHDSLYISEEDNITVPQNSFCLGNDAQTKQRVAIVCFDPEDPSYSERVGYMKIYSICLLISDLFLVITLIVYIAFPSLRDLQGKSVMSFTACLCLGYFLLAVMQQEYFGYMLSTGMCKFMGFVLYYLLMSAFFWLSLISFNTWKSATCKITWSDFQLKLAYNLIGYGFPAIFLMITVLAYHTPGDHVKPDFSSSCWFSGKSETWVYFYGPIGVLLSCNIVFFALTLIRLWKDYEDSSPGKRIQVLRFKCLLYLKLFLTMGISWIFEIVSYMFEPDIWYVTDIVNCLQGVIIFLVMVATRKRVLRLIANSEVFGMCFNKNWQTIKDEESEDEVQAEQIQLS